MNKILCLFILLPISWYLSSQVRSENEHTVMLESTKEKTGAYYLKPVACYDNGYTFIMSGMEEGFGGFTRIERIDANLKNKTQVRLNLKDMNGLRNFSNLIYFANELWLFTSYNNKKDKKLYLFANTLDKITLESNDDIRMIAAFDNKVNRKNIVLRSDYKISEDSTKLMLLVHGEVINKIYFQSGNVYDKNLKSVESSVCVLNWDMKKIWQSTLSNAITSDGFISDRIQIDNAGNCYISGQSYKNASAANYLSRYVIREKMSRYLTFELQPTNFSPSILYFGQNGLECREFVLQLPSCFLKSMTFKQEGDNLFCCGVYSDSGYYSAKGVYACKLNLFTGLLSNIHLSPFSDKLRVSMLEKNELEEFQKCSSKNDWDPYDYKLSEIIPKSNGEYILIAEQQLWGYVTESIGRSALTYPHFDYKNIYVMTMSSDGELEKTNVIDRVQTTIFQNALSYQSFLKDEDLYLLFMNLHRIEKPTYKTLPINICMVKLDANGKSSISILQEFEEPIDPAPFLVGLGGALTPLMRADAIMSLPDEKGFLYLTQNASFAAKSYHKVVFK